MHCVKYPCNEMLNGNLKRFVCSIYATNEVGDNLLKGKHGCKLKYTNNLLFNKQPMEICSLLSGSLDGREFQENTHIYMYGQVASLFS